SLAEAHVHGTEVDWKTIFAARAQAVELPTYPFQRQRYWLEAQVGAGDVSAVGQVSADHPLLGAAVRLADEQGWLFTGRLSLQTHPWLADHAVMDTPLLPGTAFVELALHAGGEAGCEVVEELTLEVPLILPEQGAVQIQLSVAEPDDSGRREIAIYSRLEDPDNSELEWTRNASGVLAQDSEPAGAQALAAEAWPPEGAEAVEVDYLYDRLAEAGLGYGPAFQGLQAAWRRGSELYAEVALDDQQQDQAERFGVHPALFDAALHTAFVEDQGSETEVKLPFTFGGVRLGAPGASAWRVRVAPTAKGAISLQAVDGAGRAALSMDSLVARLLEPDQLKAAKRAEHDSLFQLDWVEVPTPSTNGTPPGFAALDPAKRLDLDSAAIEAERHQDLEGLGEAIEAGAPVPEVVLARVAPDLTQKALPEAAHEAVHRALELAKAFLSDERFADSRLVFVTERALAARDGEAPELSEAPLWGLLRSAQSEHPERFVLLDCDGTQASWAALALALDTGEPQLALREGTALAPRLGRGARRSCRPSPRPRARRHPTRFGKSPRSRGTRRQGASSRARRARLQGARCRLRRLRARAGEGVARLDRRRAPVERCDPRRRRARRLRDRVA
ncbi:hypothetical protein LCGC14_1704020, partial [marine sediment metagenome]